MEIKQNFTFKTGGNQPPVFLSTLEKNPAQLRQDQFACCKMDPMKYTTLRSIVRFIMKIIADIEVHGIEKQPSGNFIIAANHLGRLDTAVLLCVIDREDIIMAIAEKYKNHPFYGAIGRAVNGIWLNRFEADYSALRQILARMEQGGVLAIAPEGTRSKTEALQEGKMGVAFLASKSGYPILPVALTGTEDRRVVENLKHFRRLNHRHGWRLDRDTYPRWKWSGTGHARRDRRDHVPHRRHASGKVSRRLC